MGSRMARLEVSRRGTGRAAGELSRLGSAGSMPFVSPAASTAVVSDIRQRTVLQQRNRGAISLPSMLTSPAALTAPELDLRQQVRAFLAETLPWGTFEPGLGMGAEVNREFSAALAERGWVGMAVPVRYGGRDATAVDRFVVVEELLRWGAPVGHHWGA